ncbi:RagB/SusD family nutrient uptake outer membrane protein [Saccharicrinis sp. GN24d3]|uniref:RagB/SusD family nutrient uptake outer membrane protein n=1 Tax=Saccharicrinis sp. GN24d3 TaxID=3458416 RepID=UPI004036180C
MKNILTILLISVVLFSSCDDYLDVKPSKTNEQEIETTHDINLLLNNTLDLFNSGHVISDVDFTKIGDDIKFYDNVYSVFSTWIPYEQVQSYTWQNEITAVSDASWTKSYTHIWLANYIINNVDNLEGDEDEKANLKAEAHLIRAYKFLSLAMKHCLYPSSANSAELGLPLKATTEFEELPARSTLQETIDNIETSIIEGLKIEKDRTDSWRESKGSAAALAARFYLYVHDFTNAKKYAEMALSEWNRMIDMETEVPISKKFGLYDNPSTANMTTFGKAFYSGWESQYKMYVVEDYNFYPSNDLFAMYDALDLRLKFYTQWYLGVYFGLTENNYSYTKFSRAIMTGPDVAEMYLILAECAARNSDFATCMLNVEAVRINRFAAADYVELAIPGSVKEAVQLVVDERRREFPFTSCRYSDIKRINAEGLLDPITITRDFYALQDGNVNMASPQSYTLEPNSRKYARPLPNEVVDLTDGKIEQNTY